MFSRGQKDNHSQSRFFHLSETLLGLHCLLPAIYDTCDCDLCSAISCVFWTRVEGRAVLGLAWWPLLLLRTGQCQLSYLDTEDGEDVYTCSLWGQKDDFASKSFFHLSETLFDASLPVCETLFPPAKQATITNSYHRSIVCSKKVLIALNEATVPITQTPRCSREHAIDGVIIHCKHKQTIDLTSVDHPVRGSYLTPSCHTF